MPQILVLTDASESGGQMVLSEHVEEVHLEPGLAGSQLLERMRWAVRDARQAERRARLHLVSRDRGTSSRTSPGRAQRG